MDDKDEIIANYRRSALIAAGVCFGLKNFAAQLIRHTRNGAPLDDAAIAQARERCLIDTKNTDVAGIAIEDEADILRQIVEGLEQLVDHAIAHGRQG